MRRAVLLPVAILFASPALAQSMHGSMPGMEGMAGMEGMHHPAPKPKPRPRPPMKPAPKPAPKPDTRAHDHAAMPDMPGMNMGAPADPTPSAVPAPVATGPTGTDLAPGHAAPPAVIHDAPAAAVWGAGPMAAAMRAEMRQPVYARLTLDLAEAQLRAGADGYRWEGEAFVGNLDRFVLASRGEATAGRGVDHAEVQALYARALDPWWNLQAGLRQDLDTGPRRTAFAFGIEGRARYQFQVQAQAFVSTRGEVTARLEAAHDWRLTQRWILQPRAELELSAQDMPALRTGDGLTSTELGLRLRYEIVREVAPYVGFNWARKLGKTGDYARADGHDATEQGLVLGVRAWF